MWPSELRIGVVTAEAWVAAMAQVRFLAWELLHAAGLTTPPPPREFTNNLVLNTLFL